ncbi:MAG TPA: hypothetical protein EYP41_06325, partial [Anaerolineae bacterium]|nr:hypothetical protein [Anaerolineae bacterium]
MESLCQILGVEFDPALLQPYDGRRMTDGVRPGAQMAGDFKFYLRRKIDPAAATKWQKYHTVNFLCETSEQMAQALGYTLPAETEAPLKLEHLAADAPQPLSFAQQRLWFLDQLEPDSPFYNIPAAVRLSGPLQITAVQQSLNEIVRRHEVLRTNFQTVDGKARLSIAPERQIPLPVIDLTDLPPEEQEAEVQRRAAAVAQRPFNLTEGPLLRVVILKLAETEHVFLLTMHHIISDGWSVGVFIREMAALYEAFTQGRPSPLSDLPIQYGDYAAWQRQWLEGERREKQLAYWKKQLAGIPPLLELPTDRPRPSVQTHDGAIHWFHLPPKLTNALKELSRQENVTLYATLLTAFQTLLYRYTAQEDICVGTPVAGRNRAELEDLIGFFVNTLVMRGDLSGEPAFREL